MTYDDHPVAGHRRTPVAPRCADRQQVEERDVGAVPREQLVETVDVADAALATGTLEDGARVVSLLEWVHRPMDDRVRPAHVCVAVGCEVHEVDDTGAGWAGADLAENDLTVMSAIPLH